MPNCRRYKAMKGLKYHLVAWLSFALLLIAVHANAQGLLFTLDFGSNPPPHTPGVFASGAMITNDNQFVVAIYLDETQPQSATIVEKTDGGLYVPVFQFGDPVFAGYPPPATGPAFSFDDVFQVTSDQIANAVAGLWYADVVYEDSRFLGHFVPVPEPSWESLSSLGFAAMLIAGATGRFRT